MSKTAPRICLIHAVTVAIEPVQQAFARLWPEAACTNLLDDSLSPDRARDPDLTPAMTSRIGQLARYAASTGADGILFTCSAFGTAIERAAKESPIPVLKPNEAMFEVALAAGTDIGMLATFAPSVGGMEEEFNEMAAGRARVRTMCVPDAMAALRAGDVDTHNRLLADAAGQLSDCDVVLLAHFSTARAEEAVVNVLGNKVYTSPGAAVEKLRQALLF